MLVFSIGLVGCRTVDQKTLEVYTSSVDLSIDTLNKVSQQSQDNMAYSYASSVAENGSFSSLMMLGGTDYYGYSSESDPLYLKIRKEQYMLNLLNLQMKSYIKTIENLAERNITGYDQSLYMARLSNIQLLNDLSYMNVALRGAEVFSMSFLYFANMYLDTKRTEYFDAAIAANQTNIVRYTELCLMFVRMMRNDVWTYYNATATQSYSTWQKDKFSASMDMVSANRYLANTLDLLRTQDLMYRQIPSAHKDLSNIVNYPRWIANIIGEPVRQSKQVDKLRAINEQLQIQLNSIK